MANRVINFPHETIVNPQNLQGPNFFFTKPMSVLWKAKVGKKNVTLWKLEQATLKSVAFDAHSPPDSACMDGKINC